MTTPQTLNFRQPAEWEPHSACWLAFPSHRELWLEQLEAAQTEFVELCRAIQGEQLEVLVPDPASAAIATQLLAGLPVRLHLLPFGDIWMRDIAPIFLTNSPINSQINLETNSQDSELKLAALIFAWNGWGHKYLLEHDDQVASRVAELLDLPKFSFPWVLEGGAVEVDGRGTCLTTQQCLLNSNRNPGMDRHEIEAGLKAALGVTKILWLDQGLLNDHTDGHIDTISRFIAPGQVMCMQAHTDSDPNREILEEIALTLASFTDALGNQLQVTRIPSPGLVLNADGEIMPASYLNFYIANESVVVPTYGTEYDNLAVAAIADCFPGRRTVGRSAKVILEGGGAFHCITQQQPRQGSGIYGQAAT